MKFDLKKFIIYLLVNILFLALLIFTIVKAKAQEISIVHHKDSANVSQYKVSVKKNFPHGPWVTIGPVTYQNYVQSMWTNEDSIYTTFISFINFVDSTNNPIKIIAKDFTRQGGTISDAAGYLGVNVQGESVGWINEGDWLEFKNVAIFNKTKITILFSSNNLTGGFVDFRKNSLDGEIFCTIPVDSTGSWTTFLERSGVFAEFSESIDLFITFRGAGYVCNLAWVLLE